MHGGYAARRRDPDYTACRSGDPALDDWLASRALKSELTQAARTYVVLDADSDGVAGYSCLSAHSVRRADVGGGRLGRNAPDPVPVILLGRLAVDRAHQGAGLGSAQLKDALLKSISAARGGGRGNAASTHDLRRPSHHADRPQHPVATPRLPAGVPLWGEPLFRHGPAGDGNRPDRRPGRSRSADSRVDLQSRGRRFTSCPRSQEQAPGLDGGPGAFPRSAVPIRPAHRALSM